MKIGTLDTSEKVVVIAEIGNNHEGSFSSACEMIEAAAAHGADVVKFQTIIPEKLVSADQEQRLQTLRKFQFSPTQFEALKREADRCGVEFLSTPFALEAVDFLHRLVPAWKVASGDNNFSPLLRRLAKTGQPTILSIGLLGSEEVEKLVESLNQIWAEEAQTLTLGLLHCVVSYPTPDEDAGLHTLQELVALSKNLNFVPGYSDHTLGIEAALAAVTMGARIIEKHFTLDKTQSSFRDHALSADPDDLQAMVSGIRRIEKMLLRPAWSLPESHAETYRSVRRSIAAGRDLPAGHAISEGDLCWVRPGKGWPPGQEDAVLGKKLARAIRAGEIFHKEDLVCAG